MTKRVFIHFGIHRTGSTMLQKVLKHNQKTLGNSGILYPQFGVDDVNHGTIAWGLLRNQISPHYLLKKLHNESDDSTEKIVISSEDFSLLQHYDWLHAIKAEYDTEAIVYLRRQDLWLNSWYNQNIKWPWNNKFSSCTPDFFLEHYKDFYWIDYLKLLNNLAAVLGKHKIYINVVDSLGVSDTTEDVLEHLGLDCTVPNDFLNVNASITTAKLDILRRINLFSLRNKPEAIYTILKKLENLAVKEDNGSKMAFTKKQVEFILSEFEESNSKVAQAYFNRAILFGDSVNHNQEPCFVSDYKAYRLYIPLLLKELAIRT